MVALDTIILISGFVIAFRISMGIWNIFSWRDGMPVAIVTIIIVYLGALYASGLYKRSRGLHAYRSFLRHALGVFVAWAVAIAIAYTLDPQRMPPRTVISVHALITIIGILGVRSVLHHLKLFGVKDNSVQASQEIVKSDYIEELLGQQPIQFDKKEMRDFFAGKSVMVTGGGGSIGSELCHLLVKLQAFKVVVVDVSEYNLFLLENTLRNVSFKGDLVFRIADVRDEEIMHNIFLDHRPDIILHAAAYKHVPLMERHPIEAFKNNTLSTISILRLCEQFDTEQFVFVSTDKAVNPNSVLGATKRISEWYVRAANSPIKRKIVRFGNVFASQGSAVEIFQEQIRNGGPVTVTHPDMERYFMSVNQACILILQTVLLDEASLYILDMGEPLKIREMAEKMIAKLADGKNIEITYSGMRPGEKLSEDLITDSETMKSTRHPSVRGVDGPAPFSRSELDEFILHLSTLARENKPGELRKSLFLTDFNNLRVFENQSNDPSH